MIDLILTGLGNTGLALADHIARTKEIGSVVLADHDVFTTDNVFGQAISPRSVGRAKVDVARARMAEINPALEVQPWKCRLEELPRGLFRNRIVVSGLDTRFARAALSQICFSTGVELWLDMGVRPDDRLVRVSVVFPSAPEAACLCCGWSNKDWDAIADEFSCTGLANSAPTRSPAYLGAAAAAVAAQLLERYLAGTLTHQPEARHHMMSLTLHKAWVTCVPRNVECRSSHQRCDMESLGIPASDCKLRDLALRDTTLSLPGFPHVRRLRCPCGAERPLFFIAARLSSEQTRCPLCGQVMRYGALDLVDVVDLSALEDLGPETPGLALASTGITDGDIIRLGDRYFEVGAAARCM